MKLSDSRVQIAVFVILASILTLSQVLPGQLSGEGDISALSESQFISHINQRIPEMMEDYSIPGASILIIKSGEPLWSNAYGHADREQKQPLTTESVIMAHSISKSVTAWGVMKLVQEGTVGLDDPVSKYIDSWAFPESDFSEQEVTIRRLLSNSGGVPLGGVGVHYSSSDEVPPLTESLSGDNARLFQPPGSSFEYSNSGFAILELMIQEVTGQDFAAFMEEQVLLPLDMQNSSYNLSNEMRPKIPTGYDLNGNPIPVYLYPYRASGGLFTTLEDIGRFTTAGMSIPGDRSGSTGLSQENIAKLYTPQVAIPGMFGAVSDAYGLGHFIETLPNGKKAVWHGGQGLGWMTHFHSVPELGDGIVVLTNSQRSWPFMAHILNDWSRWRSFGPVQFSIITTAVKGLRIIVGLILLFAVWRAGQVVYGVLSGRRKLTLPSENLSPIRIVEFSVSVIIAAVLVWAIIQDYLFLTSISPVETIWLGWVLLLFALVLLASTLLPVVSNDQLSNLNHERNENKRKLA